MIRLAFCLLALPLLLTGCSTYSKVTEKKDSQVASTVGQKDLVKSLKRFSGEPMVRMGRYIDAANAARLQLVENPSDSSALADYNFAVGRIIGIIRDEELTPWNAPLQADSEVAGQWTFSVNLPDVGVDIRAFNFHFLPSDRYDFEGKLVGERNIKPGLGAPVIIVAKDPSLTTVDQFAQGNQAYYGLTAVLRFDGESNCRVVLSDPLEDETVSLDDHVFELAADFEAPVAMSLAELAPRKSELAGFFSPGKNIETARLTRLQPYNADKIPVLFVHGLGDSKATWMPLVNSLRENPQVRKKYQFWFFSYPTGVPYPMTAAILRKQMDEIGQRYPDHKDIVLIGHSMGGMISRLLITDAGTSLWDTYFDKPASQLPFSAKTREVLTRSLIFDTQPRISRVIFASPSHRGSDDSTTFLGRLGAKLIGNPFADDEINDEVVANIRPEILASGQVRLPNSVEVLNPDNRFLLTIDKYPTNASIPFHSVLGDRGLGGNLDHTEPVSSDGIVPYWSSHMDGAVSETIVPSDHWTIRHPQGMAEIERILLKHLRTR